MYWLNFIVVITLFPELLVGAVATLGLASTVIILAGSGVGVRRRRCGDAHVETLTAPSGRPYLFQSHPQHPILDANLFLILALSFLGGRLNSTATAIIALGINRGEYSIEIIRGREVINRVQKEVGLSGCLSRIDVFSPDNSRKGGGGSVTIGNAVYFWSHRQTCSF